jgi:RNA polymerase-binding protein DksA
MRSYEKLREQLTKQLAVIENRHAKVDRDLHRLPDADSQERAQQAENDEVLEGLEVQSRDEIEQIRAALGRIDRGEYGDCLECGDPISAGRLEALPFTAVCIECAE